MSAISMIQNNLNNFFNAIIELISNELMYDFKIKNRFTTVSKNIEKKFMIDEEFKQSLNAIRLKMRQKTADAVFFDNVKTKLIHDKRHKSLLLKEKNKIYFKFHKNYKLSEKHNKKFSNQRCDPFLMKRRVGRFVYELKLPLK